MATILYARTSTAEQTIAHQRTHAEAMGFKFDDILIDDGVSGVSTKLKERQNGKRLFDILRHGDTLVVRWVDRLGRNYRDVTDNMREFMRRGVIVRTIINNMTFDGSTTDPVQMAVRDSLIAFMAATAQAQAEATKEAQRAGISHARHHDDGKYKGRKPSFTTEHVSRVIEMKGAGASAIAKELGLTRQTIYRIMKDPAEAIATAKDWGV